MMGKKALLGKNLEELQQVAAELDLPRFAAKQLARWLYVKRATNIDSMTDISARNRALLTE